MKKMIALLMALILTMSMFAGCASGDSSQSTTTPSTTTETVSISTENPIEATEAVVETEPVELPADYDEFDVFTYPGVEIIPTGGARDASRFLEKMGFEEMWLGYVAIADSIKIGVWGDVIVGQFIPKNSPNCLYNFRAEKADKLENKTNIQPLENVSVDQWDKLQSNSGAEGVCSAWWEAWHEETARDISIFFQPKTGNLYTFFTNKADWEDLTSSFLPSVVLMSDILRDEVKNTISEKNIPDDWNNICLDEFTLSVDGKPVTYQYRYGSSLDEWMHSEYNTDGWHRLPFNELWIEGNDYAVSPEYGYEFCVRGEVELGNNFISNEMLMINQSNDTHTFDTAVDANYNPSEFEIGSFYVANNVPMHVYGFNMYNKYNQALYEGGNGPMYRYSGWYVDYKMNTPLTIDGIGLREEDTEHMKFMLVPHYVPNSDNPLTYEKADGYPYGNDIEAIREAATELEVEFKPYAELPQFWSEYMNDILPDYGFGLVLNAKDIEGFETGVAYDICITYDDEVVYWLFMPEFTN